MDYKAEIYKICDEMTQLAFDIATIHTLDIQADIARFAAESKRIEKSFRNIYNIMCNDETTSELLVSETERIARNMCIMDYVVFSRIKDNTPIEAMQRGRLHAISWIGYLIKRIKMALDGRRIENYRKKDAD